MESVGTGLGWGSRVTFISRVCLQGPGARSDYDRVDRSGSGGGGRESVGRSRGGSQLLTAVDHGCCCSTTRPEKTRVESKTSVRETSDLAAMVHYSPCYSRRLTVSRVAAKVRVGTRVDLLCVLLLKGSLKDVVRRNITFCVPNGANETASVTSLLSPGSGDSAGARARVPARVRVRVRVRYSTYLKYTKGRSAFHFPRNKHRASETRGRDELIGELQQRAPADVHPRPQPGHLKQAANIPVAQPSL